MHTLAELDSSELKQLDNDYRVTDSQYCALVSAYNKERQTARAKKRLKSFPPLSLWNPDKLQYQQLALSLCGGPSNIIVSEITP